MMSSDRPRAGESSPGRAAPISRAAFLRGAAAAMAGGVAFPLLSACSSGGSAPSRGAGSDVVKVRNAFVAVAGLPAVLSSYEAGGTIAKDLIAKNRNFTIDPGGGNAPPGEGVPYYWGMRANWGLDGFKLQGTYFAQKLK